MSKKKWEEELKYKYLLKHSSYQYIYKSFTTLIKWGTSCFFGYLSIDALAGKITKTDISFDIGKLLKIDFDSLKNELYIILVLLSLGYALFERRLRRKETKRFSQEINLLQKEINPDKKSSHLKDDGSTNKDDIE